MAVTVRTEAKTNGSGTTATVTLSTRSADDLLVAVLYTPDGGTASTPTGWDLRATSPNDQVRVYTRIATNDANDAFSSTLGTSQYWGLDITPFDSDTNDWGETTIQTDIGSQAQSTTHAIATAFQPTHDDAEDQLIVGGTAYNGVKLATYTAPSQTNSSDGQGEIHDWNNGTDGPSAYQGGGSIYFYWDTTAFGDASTNYTHTLSATVAYEQAAIFIETRDPGLATPSALAVTATFDQKMWTWDGGENYSDGPPVAAGDLSPDEIGSASADYDNARANTGSISTLITETDFRSYISPVWRLDNSGAGAVPPDVYVSMYLNVDALPASGQTYLLINGDDYLNSLDADVVMNDTGQLRIESYSYQSSWTTATVPVDTWVRIDFKIDTVNDVMTLRYFDNAAKDLASTTGNATEEEQRDIGTNADWDLDGGILRFWLGQNDSAYTGTYALWIDDVAIRTGGWPAPRLGGTDDTATPTQLGVTSTFDAPQVSASATLTALAVAGSPNDSSAGVSNTAVAPEFTVAGTFGDSDASASVTTVALPVGGTFDAPQVHASVTLTALAGTSGFDASQLHASGAPATLIGSATFDQPQGHATVTLTALAVAGTLDTPTVVTGATATTTTLTVSSTFGDSDASASVTLTALPAIGTFDSPTVANNVNATAGLTTLIAASTFDPVTVANNVNATPQALSLEATGTLPTPNTVGEVNATATAPEFQIAGTFDPVVAYAGSAASLTALTVQVSADSPTVENNVNADAPLSMLTSASTFPPATVENNVNATAPLSSLPVSSTFSTVSASASAAASTLTASSTFGDSDASATTTLEALPVSSTFPSVTAVATSGDTALLTALPVTSTFDPVTATGEIPATATATILPIPATFDGVTAVGEVNATAVCTALAATSTFDPVIASGSTAETATPTILAVTGSFDQPQIHATATVSALTATSTFDTATVVTGATATGTALPVAATFDTPTVANEVNATAAGTALEAVGTFPAVAASGGTSATATCTTLVAAATFDATSRRVDGTRTPTILTASIFTDTVVVHSSAGLTILPVPATWPAVAASGEIGGARGRVTIGHTAAGIGISFATSGASVTEQVRNDLELVTN